MRVKELIKILQELDQDRLVMLSSDPEGNDYRMVDAAVDLSLFEEDGPNSIAEVMQYYALDPWKEKSVVVIWPI